MLLNYLENKNIDYSIDNNTLHIHTKSARISISKKECNEIICTVVTDGIATVFGGYSMDYELLEDGDLLLSFNIPTRIGNTTIAKLEI